MWDYHGLLQEKKKNPCIFIWDESTCVVSLVYKNKWINEESHKKIKGKNVAFVIPAEDHETISWEWWFGRWKLRTRLNGHVIDQ